MNSNVSKYDMRHNPVYQIDCQIAASGKRVSATKRRVRFRFGFSNREAVAKGCTGTDCRGEEHEINLVWSLTSGKRTVTADGQEVHFSAGRRDTKFETSWSMAGGHIMKLVAYAAQPLFPQPGVIFRQYDLQIDGLSFFEIPRIYELGVVDAVRKVTGRSTQRNVNFALPSSHDEGKHWTHQAGHSEEHFTAPMARTTAANNDHMVQRKQAPRPHVVPQDLVSDPTPVHTLQNRFNAPVAMIDQVPTVGYGPEPSHPVVDEFVPVQPIHQEPSFQNVADQILSAYAPAHVAPSYALSNQAYGYEQTHDAHTYSEAPAAQPVTPDSSMSSISYSPQSPTWDTSAAQEAFIPMTMEPLSLRQLEEAQQPEMSPMEKAIKSLVNLSDLMETVATPEHVKTMEKKKSEKSNKSQPLPPTAPEWHLGGHASLSDIKQHSQPKTTAKKEVMRIHAFDPAAAQAGMMVLYGATRVPQQQVYYGGTPSAAGFGAGVQQVHYGHQQLYAAY